MTEQEKKAQELSEKIKSISKYKTGSSSVKKPSPDLNYIQKLQEKAPTKEIISDSPQTIASKLNSIPGSLSKEVIANPMTPQDVVEAIKNLQGNDRIDISHIRNGENIARMAQRQNIDMNDQRWHGGGSSGGTVGPGTINQIAYFDTTNTVASLTTATYPSLTELSYVKGVTSSIQTQLDSKLTPTTGQYKLFVTVGTANADYLLSNYSNDLGTAVNAAYAGLPTSGGVIWVLDGTYSYATPIVFGTANKFVSFRSGNAASTYLKYTPTSGNAITINYGNPTGHLVNDITGFTLMGKSTLIAAGQVNTNTSIGIFYGGGSGAVGINTHDVNINGFGSDVEWGQNAYMLQFNNVAFSGGNGGQASRGSLVHIDGASNSGERNVFNGCSFTDPGNSLATNAIYITNAGTASNAFFGCSLDSAQVRVGASDGTTLFSGCHFENPGAPTSYPEYIPILGVSSDSSTQITLIGNEFANSGSNVTWTTIIRHGGQLYAAGNHIDNYNGHTVTNFVLHDLDNGQATDYVVQTSVQGGALTNIIGGSGGVAYSLASAGTAMFNVQNSYSIGLRAQGSNTNQFFSGSNTTGTYDHSGNWVLGTDTSSTTSNTGNLTALLGVATFQNENTRLDASTFAGADIGAKINAAYLYGQSTLGYQAVDIFVPAGVYSYSTPIVFGVLGKRVRLWGITGAGTELQFTGGAGTIACTINTGEQNAGSNHTSYVAIENITFTGNRRSTTTPEIGVYMGGTNGSAHAVLRNVVIQGFGQGVYGGQHNYHSLLDSCTVRNCGQLMYIAAANDSGEALHYFNCFFVDPFDATYATSNAIQFADSATSSALFSGCSFDDMSMRIGQANNVTTIGCHWENPGSANWGAYTYVVIDNNLATNFCSNGDTWFATGSTSPTNYISTGGNVTLNGAIVRKFTGSTMTNFAVLTGSGRITWTGFNNVGVVAFTNVVSGVAYTPNGFVNQAGAFFTLDNSAHPFYWATNTAGGTTGAQTINKTSGTVNFAAAASTLVVTNSLVSATSIVLCVVRTADATATIKSVVPTAGSFTITLGAAATAETSVGFMVTN